MPDKRRQMSCVAGQFRPGTRQVLARIAVAILILCWVASSSAQQPPPRVPSDAVSSGQQPSVVQPSRPEQKKTAHDLSDVFNATNAKPSSPVVNDQPKQGKISGFDFYRDPLNADRPNQPPEEIVQKETTNKAAVMAAQRALLERRYNLEPRLDPQATMSRGKPLPVGPTARLSQGVTWQQVAELPADSIRARGIFPYPALPHPLQSNGGQVFPKMQIERKSVV